jgi:hypothetical protein
MDGLVQIQVVVQGNAGAPRTRLIQQPLQPGDGRYCPCYDLDVRP